MLIEYRLINSSSDRTFNALQTTKQSNCVPVHNLLIMATHSSNELSMLVIKKTNRIFINHPLSFLLKKKMTSVKKVTM